MQNAVSLDSPYKHTSLSSMAGSLSDVWKSHAICLLIGYLSLSSHEDIGLIMTTLK